MTKYSIPVVIEFDGKVIVQADTEEEARILAVTRVVAQLKEDNLTFDKRYIDQVIYNPSGYPVIRDNESVEEREEGEEEI